MAGDAYVEAAWLGALSRVADAAAGSACTADKGAFDQRVSQGLGHRP